jgi:metallo-beta-lactamase family protein
MLPDAAHLQEEEARYANKKGFSKHAPALPLYTAEDTERALRLLRPAGNGEGIEVASGVFAEFNRMGHILGAGSVRLWFKAHGDKKSFLDSGDLGRYDRPILKDPEPAKPADWLLVESTYGNGLHSSDSTQELENIVKEIAQRRGCLGYPGIRCRQNSRIALHDSQARG